jgi:tetratricopeptide (TPR) repeat protein
MSKLISIASLLLLPAQLWAQAMTVIGGGQDAQDCFMSAQLAATSQLGGGYEEGACTFALENLSLSSRDRTATFINRGIVRVANEEYQKGFEDYKRALKLSPETPETYVNLGNVYFLGEKYSTAVGMYTKALDLNIGRNHIAHLNRGMAYEHLGNLGDAESDYQRAIELLPEWQMPRDKLLRLLGKKKKILSAQRDEKAAP